jgi:exopolysaccharide production protein ExoY
MINWKKVMDVGSVITLLPISLPIMIGVAAYIKMVSPGNCLFKQERVGYKCKTFTCYKFRTMKSNSNTELHKNHIKGLIDSGKPLEKLDNKKDTRLIPGASFLRSTGLDELPQLWNVLKGDMSLVGPRPCVKYEYDQFEAWHKERFNTLPGLTGLWQVSGKNKTTFNRMMELDVSYVRNKSIWLDLYIIFNTFSVLVGQYKESNVSLNKKVLVNEKYY